MKKYKFALKIVVLRKCVLYLKSGIRKLLKIVNAVTFMTDEIKLVLYVDLT